MTKRKILIDTDPGIDDAYAIISAFLYENFDVLGIMCVAGNKSLPIVTPNALRLVDYFNVEVPVVKGAQNCLDKLDIETENLSGDFHGNDGMGGSELPYSNRCLVETPAWDFMLDQIKKYPNEIELITLGPLTNIALAIQKDKETMKKLKSITIMGGAMYHKGNRTDYAEYNIWFDAKSCDIVVRELADDVKITFVGLDATHGTVLEHKFFDFISYEGGELGQLLEKIVRPYLKAYYHNSHLLGAYIHDLYTVLSLIDPSIINKQEKLNVQVQLDDEHIGYTKPCDEGKPVYAIMGFDNTKLKRLFLNLIMPDKKDIIEEYLPIL